MLYYTRKLLDQEKVNELAKSLMSSVDWVDGKISNMGSQVKRNLQLSAQSKKYKEHDFTFYDEKAIDKMAWFDHLTGGHTHTDFFAVRPTDYSKANEGEDFEDIW